MATTVVQALSAREFMEMGHVSLALPETFSLAEQASKGFARFLESVPPERQDSWTFNVDGNEDPDRKPDDGLLRRNGEKKVSGGQFDDKVIFHYRPRLMSLLTNRGTELQPWMFPWLNTCRALYTKCFNAAVSLAGELDQENPGFNFVERLRAVPAQGMHVLRLLLYSERGVQDPCIVGQGHCDRNFLTLQVAESRAGLRIFPYRGPVGVGQNESENLGEPVPYVAHRDQVLAFPGKKFEVLTGKRALWHDIVNDNPVAPKRWSVIFFSHIDLPL